MFESFPNAPSEHLELSAYLDDFYQVFENGIAHLYKLERGQHFKERGFASWEAFAAGEWDRAISLIEEKREAYEREFEDAGRRGIVHRRVRIVEFPVTPYVQWELHVLRLRVEEGDDIRVVDARTIADIEEKGLAPEVVILGDSAMYEVLYDADGNLAGANRISDPAVIADTSAGFEALFERAETFDAFFDREISNLAAPAVAAPTD